MLDVSTDVERVVHAPAPRGPDVFRDEKSHHQGLEHAAPPGGHDPGTAIAIGSFENPYARVLGVPPLGLLALRAEILGEGPVEAIIVLRRQLTPTDPEIAGDPGF